ncbi:MAG: CHAT domain-containing protein [Chitinophagaceae bacterium]|nr:CHAT domain-containing protein [Chitinophagaceae bacterium]
MMRIVACSILTILIFGHELHSQTWQQYRDKADTFRVRKNIDSAIENYKLAKELIPADSIYSNSYILLLTNTGNLFYLGKSQYSTAEIYYLEAREIIKKKDGSENDKYAMNANFLGQVNYQQRKYRPAETYYLEAKQIWERLFTKKSSQYAISCNALGILYNDDGQFEKAEAEHLEARAIREQLFTKENAGYAQSCNNLAAIYWNLGRFDKGEPLAIEAKEIRGRVAGIPKSAYAISCVNLGNIYRDMGKYEKAEALYIEAKNAREIYFTKEHDDYALSCDILADLYYFMKQFHKAEPLYLEAKGIRERIDTAKQGYYYGQSCSSIAALYREMGKYKEAESLALEAQKIWENLGSAADADLAINTNSLGALYFNLEDYNKSEHFFLKAREMWKKRLGVLHPFYTENSLSLARVYRGKNEIEKANDLYINAFEAQNAQAGNIFSFTSEDEKQLYLKNITGAEDEYQSFYFSKMNTGHKGQPYLISLQKRNQILASSQQLRHIIYTSGDTVLTTKYDNWLDLKKQIAALYAKGDMAPQDHLKTLIEKADVLEKDIVRSSAVFKKMQPGTIDWKAIRQLLTPGEATIEFIEFNYFDGHHFTDSIFYAALVIRPGMEEPKWVTLFEKKQLEKLLTRTTVDGQSINRFYTRGLKVGSNNTLSTQAFNTIWKPLENILDGVTTIYFSPAGLLHRIAFASLPVDSLQVLSDKYNLVQLSTTAALANRTADVVTSSDKIFLFGGIKYSLDSTSKKVVVDKRNRSTRSGFNYLPGTAAEVKGIAKTGQVKNFSTTVLQGMEARENAVKMLNDKQSPKVLHIATHGFFFPDPGDNTKDSLKSKTYTSGKAFQQSDNPLIRSGLVFAGANDAWNGKYVDGQEDDGILTAYEVSNLYLPNTKLVVLSACETALGDIKGSEGVYGLQRAFKMAGVENLVMSLWKVPDNETAEFMQLFYNKLFEGKAIDKSFYEAQAAMRNKYRRSPFKWAAWILVK